MHLSITGASNSIGCFKIKVAAGHLTANTPIAASTARFRKFRISKGALASTMADKPASLFAFHCAQFRISFAKWLAIDSEVL
mgnify:CR=1 FL=1